MHSSSRMFRSIAMCLLFVFSFNIFGGSYVLANEEVVGFGTTEAISSTGDVIEIPSLIADTFSGSESVVEVLTGETISVDTGSTVDTSSRVILPSSGGTMSGEIENVVLPVDPIIDTGATSPEFPETATTIAIKKYIENIETTDSVTEVASGVEMNITPEIKEEILDEYMDQAEKTKLSDDQMQPFVPVTESEITSILREAIANEGGDTIRLLIKTSLDTGKLQELFGFFDATDVYTFTEQYRDIYDEKTVYEMTFSRESTFGKRILEYLDAGVVPDDFFNQVEIIRPGLVYNLAGSGYLDGESSTLNWGIQKIKADVYQYLFAGKPRIKIGVIDTGVDITHPDLISNIYTNPAEIAGNNLDDDNNGYIDDVNGYSFVYSTGVVRDVHSHGTHVAGIIGASVNAKGIYGVYSRALIVPLKALGDTGFGSTYGISNAIRYAADNGIPVINMSLGSAGTPTQTDMLCAAITYARSKGTVSIVSAGNSNINITGFSPSGCQDAIAVGAVDSNITKASFSNYGAGVLISAPGVSIYSTLPGGTYGGKSGTSMAAPFVAGAVGAIFAMAGTMDTDQVRTLLSQNGDSITSGVPMGVSLNMEKIFTALGISPNPMNPIIILSGSSTMNVALGGTFVDPGATCTDDVDPTCTVTVSGSVNTALSGTYLITYSAVDGSGNLAIPLVRTVRVSDLTPPVITLSGAVTMTLVVGALFIDPGAICTDNYDLTCTVTISGSVNTSVFGAHILTYSAKDFSGNKSVVLQRTVNIVATAGSPVITLSGSSTMNITLGGTFVDPGATCTDDVDPTCTVTVSGSVNTTLSGTYLLTYSAVDGSGNLAIPLIRTVRVSDLTPPVITLSGASVITILVGTQFMDPGATCTDNYDTGGLDSPGGTGRGCFVNRKGEVLTNQTGSYILTYSAMDSSGNKAIDVLRTVNVVVSIAIPPVITLSGSSTMNIALGSTFVDPGATCTDDVDPTCTVTVSGSVNTNIAGTYLLIYRAVDTSGNIAIPVTRTVIVSDFTPPTITLSGSSTMNIALGSTFVDPGARCADDVDPTCIVTVSGSVKVNIPGSYILVYSARDIAGNLATSVSRTVIVTDITAPVITLFGSGTMNILLGTIFVDPGATCRDNYDGVCTVSRGGSVNTSQTGTYLLTYSARDISGNNATIVTRTVLVYQAIVTPPPVVVPPPVTPPPVVTPTPPIISGPGGGGGGGSSGNPVIVKPTPPETPSHPKEKKNLLPKNPIILNPIVREKIIEKLKKFQSETTKKTIVKSAIYGTVQNTKELIVRKAKNLSSEPIVAKLLVGDRVLVSDKDPNGWSFIKTLSGYWGYVRSYYLRIEGISK